jgi:hypothetical protein
MDVNENVIEFVQNSSTATVTFTQGRYISRIRELAEKKPDKCQIMTVNKDGSIVAHIPTSWIKINPDRELTDEQRAIMSERAKNVFHTDNCADD